jgi:DNA-directed RNA polymerase subunit RPC12/RpoP
MPTKFTCPCGQKLTVSDDMVGKHVRCPKCRRVLTPPQPLLSHTEINEPDDNAETKKVPPVPPASDR